MFLQRSGPTEHRLGSNWAFLGFQGAAQPSEASVRLVGYGSFTSTHRGDLRSPLTSALPRDRWGAGGAGRCVDEETGLVEAGWFWTTGPGLPPGWAGPIPFPGWGAPGPRGSCIREGRGSSPRPLWGSHLEGESYKAVTDSRG